VRIVLRDKRTACRQTDASGGGWTLGRVVSEFVRVARRRSKAEFIHFERQESLEAVRLLAARCELPNGKRHPHQYRLPRRAIREMKHALSITDLSTVTQFDDLHNRVLQSIGRIRGVGPLTTYDVATRIAAFLEIEPEKVYLHRGVTDGARALGIDTRGRKSLDPGELPKEFRRLTPGEIEDCLCIFKKEIALCRSR
jgi:hypothetical protein